VRATAAAADSLCASTLQQQQCHALTHAHSYLSLFRPLSRARTTPPTTTTTAAAVIG
jgi:hypothetical protein